jgi:hypothetical protein
VGVDSRIDLSNNIIDSDPKFLDASKGDFRLKDGSPAIDKGTTISEIVEDIDRVKRPQGNGYDIGAYEYRGNQLPPPKGLRTVEKH